jgi:hypothetical protein
MASAEQIMRESIKQGIMDNAKRNGINPQQETYQSLRGVLDAFRDRQEAINRNDMLPDKARARMKGELKREMRDAFYRTKAEIEQRQQSELLNAWKQANPMPNVAQMTAGQIQARQEVIQDIEDIAGRFGDDPNVKRAKGEAILDLYAKYYNQGYDIGMDTIAQRGSRHLNADQFKELQGLEETRNPGLAQARKNYEDVKKQHSAEATGGALIESVFLSSTALSGDEAEAVANADTGQRGSE